MSHQLEQIKHIDEDYFEHSELFKVYFLHEHFAVTKIGTILYREMHILQNIPKSQSIL
jgi:hypothetical protein